MQDTYNEVRNAFVNRQESMRQNALAAQQDTAKQAAGQQFAGGDFPGAANTLAASGNIAGAQQVQTYSDAQRQQHAQAAQRISKGIRAAVTAGHTPAEAFDMATQVAPDLGIDPAELQRMRPAYDKDPRAFLDFVDQQAAKELQVVNRGNGGYDVVDKATGNAVRSVPRDPTFQQWDPAKNVVQIGGDAPAGVPAAAASGGPAANGSRAARNNNPLNLTTLPQGQWSGQSGADGRFATFSTPEAGMAAADKNLQSYATHHGVDTLAGIINRWAPKGDGANDPQAYTATVAKDIGVDPNQKLNLADPQVRKAVLQSMAKVEAGGASGPSAVAPTLAGGAGSDAVQPNLPPGVRLVQPAGAKPGENAAVDPNIVKGLIEGRIVPPTQKAAATPYWQAQLQAATQQDPTFDGVNFQARAKTRADFTSGKSAVNITALNTVVGHLDSLDKAIDKLGNYGGFPGSTLNNKLAHAVAGASGTDERIRTFETSKEAVANELTRVFRGTGGAEADIKAWKQQLDSANSPTALHATVRQMAELINSRMEALGEQYNQGMGTTKEPIQLLTADKQRAFRRLSGGGSPAQAAAPKAGAVLRYDASGNRIQ